MAIDSLHPDYEANQYSWWFCETFNKGSTAVKESGTKLLPQLNGQSLDKYNAYKNRSLVPGFVPRTTTALVGAIFRKEPHFKLPTNIQYLVEDCTGTGVSLSAFALRLITEVLVTGRAGIHVDRSADGGKPYFVNYDADDIRNWSDNEDKFIVLEDCQLVSNPKDKYELQSQPGFRELFIDEQGFYAINVWREKESTNKRNKEKDKYEIVETIQPLKAGKPMSAIPFITVNSSSIDFEISKPPILELCEVANSSYLVSADYFNALHVIGSPTPYVCADLPTDKTSGGFELKLGCDSCIVLPMGSTCGFLESTTDVGALKEALAELKELAAVLGAKLLQTDNKGGETDTAAAAMIKEGASTAILSSIISAVEQALLKCLLWAAEWESSTDTSIEVKLNKELVHSTLDANMVTSLLKAYLEGAMSIETLYSNLEEGGLTQPGVTVEKEVTRIKDGLALKKAATEAKTPVKVATPL